MGTEKWKTLVGNDNDYRALSGRGGWMNVKLLFVKLVVLSGSFEPMR